MANDLIPTYQLSDFQKLSAPQLKQLKSCEIEHDGQYLFTFINPQTDYIKVQSQYKGQLSNSLSGKDLFDILPKEETFPCDTCGKEFDTKLKLTGHHMSHSRTPALVK